MPEGLPDIQDTAPQPPTPLPSGVDPTQVDSQQQVSVNLRCIICDYNLRTQLATARCPECGTPVRHSLRAENLSAASNPWLQDLRQAAAIYAVAQGIAAASLLVQIALRLISRNTFMEWRLILVAAQGIGMLFSIVGALAFAAREPRLPPGPKVTRLRLRVRLLFGCALGLLAASWLSNDVVSGRATTTLIGLAVVAFGLMPAALAAYAGQFCHRVADRAGARFAWVSAWVTVPVAALVGGLLTTNQNSWLPIVGESVSRLWLPGALLIVFVLHALLFRRVSTLLEHAAAHRLGARR